MYCNPIHYFTEIEDGKLRGDNSESIVELVYIENAELSIKPADDPSAEFKKLPLIRSQLITRRTDPFGNLFCMYAVDTKDILEDGSLGIDKRNTQFGNHLMVIFDSDQFLDRIVDAVKKLGQGAEIDFVEYIEMSKHSGKKSIFQKDISYAYQQEFRIFIPNYSLNPIKLNIGDISSFSKIYPIEILPQLKAYRKSKFV